MFQIVKGDLFSEKKQPLCHCISKDYAMSLGIAVKFRQTFGTPKEKVDVGNIVITSRSDDDQIAINLVTKEKYWQKPTFESLKSCLQQTRQYCLTNNIKSISMPKIGCGLDKLDWCTQVEPAIREMLSDIKVNVYVL